MLNELYNVDFVLTGERAYCPAAGIGRNKKAQAKYNRMRKSSEFTHCIDTFTDKQGIINFKIVPFDESEKRAGIVHTYFSARERLDSWIEHTAVHALLRLTSEEAVCFNHQIKKCNGICADEEDVEVYNRRAVLILSEHQFRHSNFVILDKGRKPANIR